MRDFFLIWRYAASLCSCGVHRIEPHSVFGVCRMCHVKIIQGTYDPEQSPSSTGVTPK